MSKLEIITHLSALGLGLKRKTVFISPPKVEWVQGFEFIRQQLLAALANCSVHIEHTGSTSVPGLSAKPVLDILLVLEEKSALLPSIPILENLGFEYKGDGVALVQKIEPDPERHFFSFYNDEQNTDFIHLHMYAQGHPDIARLLGFRDRLRANVLLREKYQALKMQLWNEGQIRRQYTCSKSKFIYDTLKNSAA